MYCFFFPPGSVLRDIPLGIRKMKFLFFVCFLNLCCFSKTVNLGLEIHYAKMTEVICKFTIVQGLIFVGLRQGKEER